MDLDDLRSVRRAFRRWRRIPEYSADFFDGQHYVMKGASPATASELLRRSFRNWFRPNYPYVYAEVQDRGLSRVVAMPPWQSRVPDADGTRHIPASETTA